MSAACPARGSVWQFVSRAGHVQRAKKWGTRIVCPIVLQLAELMAVLGAAFFAGLVAAGFSTRFAVENLVFRRLAAAFRRVVVLAATFVRLAAVAGATFTALVFRTLALATAAA